MELALSEYEFSVEVPANINRSSKQPVGEKWGVSLCEKVPDNPKPAWRVTHYVKDIA